MNLYEFQAKELLVRFGVEIPRGRVAGSGADAERLARRLAFPRFAIKAQIHGGARGKAGGIRFASSPQDAGTITTQLLSRPLVTSQTKPSGEIVRWVYIEEAFDIETEVYAAVVLDRATGELALLVSPDGGEDIEAAAQINPNVIARFPLTLTTATLSGDFESAARLFDLPEALHVKAVGLLEGLAKAAVELDATLVEINPLAITRDSRLIALDAKLTIDPNALFRHPALAALRGQIEVEEGDPNELAADKRQINYQQMDGEIGIVVNGAGLALATLDAIVDAGGRPANFMDIRTTASSLDIAYGIGMILDNPKTRAVLINIHGGGMQRCDTVAEGLTVALRRARRQVPLIVRLAGNNADFARVRLKGSGVDFIEADDVDDAAQRVMAVVSAPGSTGVKTGTAA
jgi:succinyl-CoA synthetase beta subunit